MERNKPCHCGSGKKYKKCHILLDRGWKKNIDELWMLPSFEEILKMVLPKKKKVKAVKA